MYKLGWFVASETVLLDQLTGGMSMIIVADGIRATQFPAPVPRLALAAYLYQSPDGNALPQDPISLRFAVVNPAGKHSVLVTSDPQRAERGIRWVAVVKLILNRPGTYHLKLEQLTDDAWIELASLPFVGELVEAPALQEER